MVKQQSPAPPKKGNPDALLASRRKASEDKQAAAERAVQELLREGIVVSFAEVAKRAKVSRPFLYRNEGLALMIETAMRTQQDNDVPAQRAPRSTPIAAASLRSDLAAAHQEIKRLREENTRLRADLRMDLGAQAEALDREDVAHVLAEKMREVDRLVSENAQLTRSNAALTRANEELTEDLTAERRAYAASAKEGNIRQLRPSK